jgi:hypothetical protein
MLGGELGVKWLDAQCVGVRAEALVAHQRNGSEPANVAVVHATSVVELDSERRIRQLFRGKFPVVDQQRAREARLHHDVVAGRQIEHDELGAAPAAFDAGGREPFRQAARVRFAQDVRLRDSNRHDARAANLAIQIAGDRLGLWQLGHP